MLVRRHRFHGLGSLRSVYRGGRSLRGNSLNLRYQIREHKKNYRVAVVVSAKVSKSAVKRNRIRRRIFEVIRLNQAQIKPGSDLVFTVYSDKLADTSFEQLSDLVKELISQIK